MDNDESELEEIVRLYEKASGQKCGIASDRILCCVTRVTDINQDTEKYLASRERQV